MKSENCSRKAALLCALLVTGGGLAQAAGSAPVYSLSEVVVTATKIAEEPGKVPAEVSVVTADDIQKHNYTNTSQVLGQLPGVFLNPAADGGSSGGDSITMRGFSSRNVLVMVDGQPVNSGWNGDVNWTLIPVENIQRIEVVRGAASSLYGGRAVGGVIQITTKNHEKGLHGDVVLSYGSNATTKQVYDASFGKDKWDFDVGYEKRKTHGWRGYYIDRASSPTASASRPVYETDLPTSARDRYIVGGRGRRANKTETYHVKASYHFNDDQSLTYSYTHSDWVNTLNGPFSYIRDADGNQVFWGNVRLPNGRYVAFEPDYFLGYVDRRELAMHNISYDDNRNLFHARFGITDIKKDGYTSAGTIRRSMTSDELDDWNGPGSESFYPSKTRDFDMNKTWELGRHTLLAGMAYRQEEFNQTRYNTDHFRNWSSHKTAIQKSGGKDESWAGYIQDKWQATDRLAVYAGVRYDRYKKKDGHDHFYSSGLDFTHESATFTEWSPKFSVEYSLPADTTIYASYGHSFTPPILNNVYRSENANIEIRNGQQVIERHASLANADLKPETTDTYEIGVKKKWGDKTNLNISLYRANTDDAIRYYSTYRESTVNGVLYPNGFSQYRNLGNAAKKGVEIELNHNFSKAWSSYLNWAWESEKLETGHNYDIPRHILHFGARYQQNKWDVLADAEFISSRNAPDTVTGTYYSNDPFFIANLSANYAITPAASVQFSVYNLLDRKFYAGEAASERTYTVTMRYSF